MSKRVLTKMTLPALPAQRSRSTTVAERTVPDGCTGGMAVWQVKTLGTLALVCQLAPC